MGRRGKRMKASDVSREANFLFAKKVPFEEAFAEIEDIFIEATQRGRAKVRSPQKGLPDSKPLQTCACVPDWILLCADLSLLRGVIPKLPMILVDDSACMSRLR